MKSSAMNAGVKLFPRIQGGKKGGNVRLEHERYDLSREGFDRVLFHDENWRDFARGFFVFGSNAGFSALTGGSVLRTVCTGVT
ncbi:MAG: hypothetical protein OEM83_09475, partial [Gammaproteobacteria bacterium]|nr:hypothetical protein [Gammaproteobacteria bacterium]